MWDSANLFSNDELVKNGLLSDLKNDRHEIIYIKFNSENGVNNITNRL